MPYRLNEFRAKVQFTTSAAMPSMIYKACLRTGIVSNTVYCQIALAEALARDLGIDLDEILADLPEPRGPAKHLYDPTEGRMSRFHTSVAIAQSGGRGMIGPANTIEEVK